MEDDNNTASKLMNDDIKEARLYLEHISKDDFNLEEHQKENRIWAIKVLLDYITNLQHENERLKELDENYPIEEELAEAYRREEDYKSRIEKALLIIEKQKKKMYKSRNKIAMFILIKLDNTLNGRSDD